MLGVAGDYGAPVLHLRLPSGHEMRPLAEGDAEELYRLIDANRARLARWMAWAEDQTPQGTLEFIRGARMRLDADDGLQAAIIGEQGIVGVAGFHGVDWANRSTSLGYWLAESEEGGGTMTHAVRALVDHAFGRWRLNRVEIRADVENVRSRALAERLGFRLEGTLRQALKLSDGFHDDALYALLAEDWPPVAQGEARRGARGISRAARAPMRPPSGPRHRA
jgi:ribosomal-protein-serine acetyltransferase